MIKSVILLVFNFFRNLIISVGKPSVKIDHSQLMGLNTRLVLHRKSFVEIQRNLVSDGRFVIITDSGSNLRIGDHVYFNEDGMISCKGSIYIGNRCKFGPNVKIFDNNHLFNKAEGVLDKHKVGEISIGDKCWIGSNVVILKGAKIGEKSVIGAGCIIDTEIPPCSVVTQQRELLITPMRDI